MTIGGRPRRPDDWPSSHVRARAAISDQLDGPIAPEETAWLDEHLDACPDCRRVAAAYAEQQRELWALRDTMPVPPRDLWARTAAAIEAESRFKKGQKPALGWSPKFLIPSALIASALVVAVAAGSLTSSWWPGGGGTTGPTAQVAAGSTPVTADSGSGRPGPTNIPVNAKVAVITRSADGGYRITEKKVDSVCPKDAAQPCNSDGATEDHPVAIDTTASTVFGSVDKTRLIVVSDPSSGTKGTVSVVSLASSAPSATPTPGQPSSAPPATPTVAPTPSAPPPTPTVTPTPSTTASSEPSPSVAVSAPPDGPIEIAHDVVVVGQSAAYSDTGTWFAFTARPVDGSAGPDIYVWKVGDPLANAVTSDHRSMFGSWIGDTIVGSTVLEVSTGNGNSGKTQLLPSSYLLDPATKKLTALPQTGSAWRPAVAPNDGGARAIYWTGTLQATTSSGFAPDAGRLVLGDWGTGGSAPTDGPFPTSLHGNQADLRHETTIDAGRVDDWDARWDSAGTHVAIWIADSQDPTIGRLSLYTVDTFDGRIDLKTPLLDAKVARSGFAISDHQLVWAEPAPDGSTTASVQLLAWTDTGVGTTLETITGPAIVIR